jgi:hypothetical protein
MRLLDVQPWWWLWLWWIARFYTAWGYIQVAMRRLGRDSQPPSSLSTGSGGSAYGVIAIAGSGGDVININHIRECPPSSSL